MQHLERALDNQNQWWKYFVMFLAAFAGGNILGVIPLVAVVAGKTVQQGNGAAFSSESLTDFAAHGISPNLGLFLLMLPFVLSLIIFALLVKPLHKRTLREVINGTRHIRWGRFFFAAGVWAALMGLYLAIDYALDPGNFRVQFDASAFFPLVAISLLIIPLQTTFEEVFFRGYLAQGLGAWTRSRWVVMIVPGVLFGLMHAFNPEVAAHGFWLTMPQYIFFGLLFGFIAIADDGIEAPMGAHAANNIFASIFLTHESSAFQTPALLFQERINAGKELVALIVLGLLFLVILARKYKWHWGIINRRIERDVDETAF